MIERKALVLENTGQERFQRPEWIAHIEERIQSVLDEGYSIERIDHIESVSITVMTFKRGQGLPVVEGDNGIVTSNPDYDPVSRIWKSEDERREWFARHMQIAPNG